MSRFTNRISISAMPFYLLAGLALGVGIGGVGGVGVSVGTGSADSHRWTRATTFSPSGANSA